MNRRREQVDPSVAFQFQNIGPVKDATLELGDLTVVAGRNNTGKTYMVYSLYGFLKRWMAWPKVGPFLIQATDDFPDFAAICEGVQETGETIISISPSRIALHRQILARQVSRAFSPAIRNVFNSRRDEFRDAKIRVSLADSSNPALPSSATLDFRAAAVSLQYENGELTVTLESHDRRLPKFDPEKIAHAYFVFLMRDLFPHPFILSAERFGISLFYRELDFTKNQIVDFLQKYGSDEDANAPFLIFDRTTSRYATPIKDNIDFTRSIPDFPRDPSQLAEHKLHDNVKNLMQGYYSNTNDDIRFISRRKSGSFNLPLHLASSSARGLCDLYFFLRYAASRNQLLIIDEPESHLDTANQVAFARLLVKFVGAGLRVLITTHSDYILKELNNLIMLSRDFPDKKKVARKLGYRAEDELRPESVRAYVAEDGTLSRCSIGRYGIIAPMFDETIDTINDVAVMLSSRMAPGIGE